MTPSQIDALRTLSSQFGYQSKPGPIRSAIEADKPVMTSINQVSGQVAQDFNAVLSQARTKAESWMTSHPIGAGMIESRAETAGVEIGEAIAAAWFDDQKNAYLSGNPVENALQPYFSEEMKSEAAAELKSRIANYLYPES